MHLKHNQTSPFCLIPCTYEPNKQISALFNVAVDELLVKTARGAWKAIQVHPISQTDRTSLSVVNKLPVAVLGAEAPTSHGHNSLAGCV